MPALDRAARDLLTTAYAAFNARDVERALATMHPDVAWPNGMEGGYVHGHDGVRESWIRQWRRIDPHVRPRAHGRCPSGGPRPFGQCPHRSDGPARVRDRRRADRTHGDQEIVSWR